MNPLTRIARHVRLTAASYRRRPSPPFLVLFVNSICNMQCEHCFYWTHLNKRDDLTLDEIVALSRSLARIENLNLSGGEPFLRKEFGQICRQFIRHNGVRQIYVPSNGWYRDKTIHAVRETLQEPDLDLLVVELSLDGTEEFHDTFRVAKGAFAKAMETYDALADLQQSDPRLRIQAISTATDVNVEEIRRLTTYLFDRARGWIITTWPSSEATGRTRRSRRPTSASTRHSTTTSGACGCRAKPADTAALSNPCCSGPRSRRSSGRRRSCRAAQGR